MFRYEDSSRWCQPHIHLMLNLILPMVWVVIIWPVDTKVLAAVSSARTKIVNIVSHFLRKWNANELKECSCHIVSGVGVPTDQITVFDFHISAGEVG